MARRALRSAAETKDANAVPVASALSRDTGARVGLMSAPDSPIAPAMRFLERGDAICALTEVEPADSPAMVTRFGSPPNAAMFFCTHASAAAWSSSPWLPEEWRADSLVNSG